MISLDSKKWSELRDAYGSASSIPNLLQKVISDKSPKKDLQTGPWFELWSRLCHQGSVYDASYAAVLSIVDAIPAEKEIIDINFFLLPTCIEIARNNELAPKILPNLEASYFNALEKMSRLAKLYIRGENDLDFKRVLKAAQLVTLKNFTEAELILEGEQ